MMEITPNLDRTKNEPLYMQLFAYLKREIQCGRLLSGTKLPSKRKLSSYLEVSQNTVESAYQQLYAEGYIESQPRKGMFVSYVEGNLFPQTSPMPLTLTEKISEEKPQRVRVDFNHGKIDVSHFPYNAWRRYTLQSLYLEESHLFFNDHLQGDESLLGQIAHYLYQSRGVRCHPDQIVLGAGTQYLLSLLCQLLGNENQYAMEDPGFHRTRHVFQQVGIQVKSIPLDEQGIDIQQLVEKSPNVVYVTPSHQFPLGMIMPISRRLELLAWAREKEQRFIINVVIKER
ncbi:PLP-dependent aminotransferase family protein [Bacillus songklensis]|uniref:PLP-dependent aminotransferase family protein n=1 Tax=Bacillus songklensis TaxID=1069116 RepID=A0ABV8B797_9BACI